MRGASTAWNHPQSYSPVGHCIAVLHKPGIELLLLSTSKPFPRYGAGGHTSSIHVFGQ